MVHTARFESVRRKKDSSLNQKSVKSCYIDVLFRGKPLERFLLAAGWGHTERTPRDSLHWGVGGGRGAKSRKSNELKIKK